MKTETMPKPTDLMDNPQLAVLAALSTAVVAAMRSLLAVHTDIFDDRFPRTTMRPDLLADRVIYLGSLLAEELRKYREALLEEEAELPEDF